MLPFRFVKSVIASALVPLCFAVSSGLAAPPIDEFPVDTTQVADRQLFFETNLGLIERATTDAVDQALDGLRLPPGSDILLHSVVNNEGSWFVEDFIARRLNQRGYNVHVPKDAPPGSVPATAPTPGSGTATPPASLGAAAGMPPSLSDATQAAEKPAKADSTNADSTRASSSTAVADSSTTVGTTPATTPGPRRRGQNAAAAKKEEPEQLIPVPEGQGLVLTIRLVEFGVTYHDSWRRGFMGPRLVERLASVNLYCRLVSDGPQNVLWVGRGKSERLDVVPKSKLDLLEGLSYPFTKPSLPPQRLSRLLEPVLVTSIIGGLVYLFYTNQE